MLEVVARLAGGDSTGLDQELINADKGGGVTARHIRDLLSGLAHHDDNTLDTLDLEVVLLSWDVVCTHDAVFWASGDRA